MKSDFTAYFVQCCNFSVVCNSKAETFVLSCPFNSNVSLVNELKHQQGNVHGLHKPIGIYLVLGVLHFGVERSALPIKTRSEHSATLKS